MPLPFIFKMIYFIGNKGGALKFVILGAIIFFGMVRCVSSAEDGNIMDQETIEKIRVKYEQEIMRINGVVSVSVGLNKDGKKCLKIGTSVPVEQISSKLPEGLSKSLVELEFIGNIQAQ